MRRDTGSRRAIYCGRKMLRLEDAARTFHAACHALRVAPEVIRGKYRGARIVEKRDIIAYVLRSRHVTFADIGLLLDRDHSSVVHAVQKMTARLKSSTAEGYWRLIDMVEQRAA